MHGLLSRPSLQQASTLACMPSASAAPCATTGSQATIHPCWPPPLPTPHVVYADEPRPRRSRPDRRSIAERQAECILCLWANAYCPDCQDLFER